MNIKGIRHITMLHRLASRPVPRSREGILSELTHLEREKARLEREMKSLLHNQKKTERHLREAQERSALLERVRQKACADHPAASGDSESGGDGRERTGRRKITLEY